MQGVKRGRGSTHALTETVGSVGVMTTTGHPSLSLTTVCDAALGFAPDILIRAITAGQPDLHLK